jgi:ABC-type lipoprotein export system ATPase subunit
MEASQDLRAGLERVALDLHVHSPASHDWQGGDITPEDLVARAAAQGLDGIAITDHQSGAWVDKLREAAVPHGVAVIPGVEVNNLAGNEGIHLIVLFDLATTAADIDLFLGAIGCITGTGQHRKRGTATKGIIEVLDEVERRAAIAVLAHCQSSKGSLSEMRGDVRTELVRHPAVLAAEAPSEEYFDQTKASERKRTYDLLDGHDPTYRRELAVYQASDNPVAKGHGHGLDGIGTRFTYFYVERPVSLESLRQCFIDRDARIVYPPPGRSATDESVIAAAPCIRGLEVTGGFLDGLDLRLHDGLTTVLGSKGSGKSLLIELLRFGLDQASEQSEIRKDHETKLWRQLGNYARVTVTVRDAGGTEHRIERELNQADDNPFHGVTFEPSEFFRCHFLSQGEIVRLAESEDEQIRFIDSFFDFHIFQRDIDQARRELATLDGQVAKQIVARKRIVDLEATRHALAARVTEKDKALSSPLFAKYQAAQAKTQLLDRAVVSLDSLIAAVEGGRTAVEATPLLGEISERLASDPLLRRVNELVEKAKQDAVAAVITQADSLRAVREAITAEQATWLTSYNALADEYSSGVGAMGGDAPALSQERARLVAALEQADKELLAKGQEAQQLRPTVERRDQLLARLEERQKDYTQARRERCDWFMEKSGGQIKASVSAATNYDAFCESLGAMKKGSYLSGSEIETIAKSITPIQFVRAILRFDLSRLPADLEIIQQTTKLPEERVLALATFLLDSQDYEALLGLEYTVTPTDRPEIRFRREDGSFAPLVELSTGQKATAFLIMALCEGEAPIIVDQPEDSLDIRSIWEDMCLRLRRSKRSRQFIFTTHNSSLAVASDSDKFIVLVADASHGQVALSGAIDSQAVRTQVLQLLEGGADTYFLKQRKYNVKDPSHD